MWPLPANTVNVVSENEVLGEPPSRVAPLAFWSRKTLVASVRGITLAVPYCAVIDACMDIMIQGSPPGCGQGSGASTE